MFHWTYKISSSDKDFQTQKCRIPSSFMERSNIKAGDVVSIDCGDRYYICRVFPLPNTELETCISIDDTISFGWYGPKYIPNKQQQLFPHNFQVVKTSTFDKIRVKVVLDNANRAIVKNEIFCRVILNLLRNYVISNNVTVKCKGCRLADMFHIHSIIISDTYKESVAFGRLTRTADIEIIEVLSIEQSDLLKEFKEADIGGIKKSTETLKTYLLQKGSRKIIISGPSGCGKTLFVKKFFSDFKCCLFIIDGLKDDNLTVSKCDMYIKQLLQSSEKFLNIPSILLIDHITHLASSNEKQLKKNCLAALVYLLKSLENSRVRVVIVSTEKKLIHPLVSKLFEDEVFLGIPTFHQRKEMLIALTRSFVINYVDYDEIASLMPGFLACDIAQLVDNATSQRKMKLQEQNVEIKSLSTSNFKKALLGMTPSLLKTSKWNMKVKPVNWKDIGGMDDIKKRLQLCIERPLRHPEMFQKVGLRCPRGVLLFGPPGCCKTTLARGLATECNATFFAANPSQIYSSYVGESEKNISQLFYQARLCAPSIIFLDELDSLVGCRTFNTKQQGVAEKILSILLNEMDGLGVKTSFEGKYRWMHENSEASQEVGKRQLQDEVIVVGATNRPDAIDDALLRPGRFDIILYVPPPNLEERVSILETITRSMPLNQVDLKKIAEKTHSFTGADLKNICSMAAINALKENLSKSKTVSEENFMQALEKAEPSVSKQQIQLYEELSNKYGPVITNK